MQANIVKRLARCSVAGLLGLACAGLIPLRAVSETPSRGPVTNLPMPRFVSLKAEAHARRGPGKDHRIDWKFLHRGLPLQVIAEYGNWRKVQDADGTGGWIHESLLRGRRTVLIRVDKTRLFDEPADTSTTVAEAEFGAIGRLGTCQPDWCQIEADGYSGWVKKAALWGVGRNEIRR